MRINHTDATLHFVSVLRNSQSTTLESVTHASNEARAMGDLELALALDDLAKDLTPNHGGTTFQQGDRVKVRGIIRYEGTVDTITSAPSGKIIVTVDLDNGMTMPCFEEELTLIMSHSGDLADLITVVPTAFSRHLNVVDTHNRHVGNIVDDERGYVAYRDVNGEDEFVGVRDSVEGATLLILPFVTL